ncbi:MAG: GTPase [Candidatus Cloacimonadota bacterium]|jgi:GTP-binding protein Era|nr:GTPase [Candidatus Cloacimonadota bacterium]
MDNFKSGFVSIVGKPNVGKSTLINKILGEKISIVTPKPQTTRQQIKGIYNDEESQIIFLDTPGFLQPRYELQHKMVEYINQSLKDSDLILYICDANYYPTDYDRKIYENIAKMNIPKLALLNKIDLVSNDKLANLKKQMQELNFEEVIPVSLTQATEVQGILTKIKRFLPYGPPFYDPDDISDLPVRFFIQEIIREQIFLHLRDELPYASTVVVEQFKETENKIEIAANIWLERKSQKIIIIGKQGQMIKKIRIASEKEIHRIMGKRIKLSLWIKIKPNWRNKKNALKEFGYR